MGTRNWHVLILVLLLLINGLSSVSASPPPPAKVLSTAVSNVVASLFKWLWSLQFEATPRKAVSSRSMMKFEGGYTVETVFDGSKLGIEPHSVEVSPSGELLVLDSENSNIYKISIPLSRYSRPKLIAGSPEGHSGHVDGKPKEARMNHPKGLAIDERGNVYIADTVNMAIRKIGDGGMTTIAGGKWGRGGGHVDGPSEDAKFSDDFDVVYVGTSCSLLVIDRGNQAIREIQLHDGDCSRNQYDGSFHLGMAVLVCAGFFGYMLALLQQRVRAMFSPQKDLRAPIKKNYPAPPYQRSPPKYVRPPLIPNEDETETPEEGFFSSIARLFSNTGSSVAEIFTGLFSRKKPQYYEYPMHPHYQQPYKHGNEWPVQESFVIPDEDEPPSLETRTPTPNKSYPATMPPDREENRNFRQIQAPNNGYIGDRDHNSHQQQHGRQLHRQLSKPQHQQHLMQHQQRQQQQHHHRHYTANAQTYYEKSGETNEIVFGAVQEHGGRREAMVIKAVDYGDPTYNHHNIRTRVNYMGYSDMY